MSKSFLLMLALLYWCREAASKGPRGAGPHGGTEGDGGGDISAPSPRSRDAGFAPWVMLVPNGVLTSTVTAPMVRLYAAAEMEEVEAERERRK